VIALSTISTLLAAKFEEVIDPNYDKMIVLLTEYEKKYITKDFLVELEFQIVEAFDIDFNFMLVSPVDLIDRYLRILNYDKDINVRKITFDICKFQLLDAKFLKYLPSQLAACSIILAINIEEKE
jgi:hypothetical protein